MGRWTRGALALLTMAWAGVATPTLAQTTGPAGDIPVERVASTPAPSSSADVPPLPTAAPPLDGTATATAQAAATAETETYAQDDVIAAAEGAFGKGAQGFAKVIEDIFRKQGRPNAYIVGREAAGAFVVGLRYGSGKLFHKVEGEKPVYWTGPSVGFDFGGDGSRVFTLIYNLDDSEDIYKRFAAVEGRAYLIGGFAVAYHRRGGTVLVPIRLGAGWRIGANVGYLKFTKKSRILPF